MKFEVFPEPDLEFGSGVHIDIRYGIQDYGPIGFDNPAAAKVIKVGFAGTSASISKVLEWMTSAKAGVEATPSKKPRFRPKFPGFGSESPFRCDWVTEARLQRPIDQRLVNDVLTTASRNEGVEKAVQYFMDECTYLVKEAKVDVIICAPPVDLLRHFDNENEGDEEDEARPRRVAGSRSRKIKQKAARFNVELDFHDMLKAESLSLSSPIQFIRPGTYDDTVRHTSATGKRRRLQDAATRAWNFHTALYYKAGGTPWRLLRKVAEFESCFVGISFFRSVDKEHIHTSVAQVFNERGEGMILRGGEAKVSKHDLQPHLSEEDMKNLLLNSLRAFEKEHHRFPPRVVLHKTSGFTDAERSGCEKALDELRVVKHRDLLVVRESDIRLFRPGIYAPLRGSFLEMDSENFLLYTRGSVPFFEMYPGLYVPRALEIELVATEESPKVLAQEILALTKMNWNNTQFDSSTPITISAARQVGAILKYAGDKKEIQSRYAFYM
jgi:hypothetical protein